MWIFQQNINMNVLQAATRTTYTRGAAVEKDVLCGLATRFNSSEKQQHHVCCAAASDSDPVQSKNSSTLTA